jgi:hypothetical protein
MSLLVRGEAAQAPALLVLASSHRARAAARA